MVLRLTVELQGVPDDRVAETCRQVDVMLYNSPFHANVRGWKAEEVEQRTATGRLI